MLKKKGNPLKVHSKVHFLKMDYSIGFFTGGGDIENWGKLSKEQKKEKLLKEWYVFWSFANPETGLMERQNNIKYGINIHKTKAKRLEAMQEIKKYLVRLFKTGYSPFDLPAPEPERASIKQAFDEVLLIKKKEVKETTYKDYESRLNLFCTYLNKNGYKYIGEIDKKITSKFLSQFNPKNSNNFRAAFSSIFSVLSDQSYVEKNFIKELRVKKAPDKQKQNVPKKDIEKAIELLKDDQLLLMYINLVSYMFWRPLECVRIEIKDIDFENRIMSAETKSKASKTKYIPDIIFETVFNYVGTRKGRLFELNAKSDIDKRGFLTERFRKFRDKNKLHKDLNPYSFRHYHITKMYQKLRENLSKEDTIKQLSLITGHTSRAIWHYIHTNDIELPDDYSSLLE